MTSTSTLRTGLSRFVNHLAALALLLVVAGGASAQSTIFVDANGGDDGNNGQQPTVNSGVNGPVRTLGRALQIARTDGAGNTISIEAGDYNADIDVENAGNSSALNNLTFLARPDQAGNTEVELDVNGGEFLTAVSGFTFARQGAGMFTFTGGGDVDFQSGSVAFGSGIVTFSDVDTVEQTNASVTGTVVYNSADLPDTIRFNGNDSTTQGTLLPASLDIASGSLLIDIALGSTATSPNDNSRTFTIGTAGLTLGDDGGSIELRVRDGNMVAGTITTVDGNGADGTGNVVIDGEGSIGTLIVAGARTIFSLQEADQSDTDADNQAGTVLVQSGQFVLPNEDPSGAGDIERFTVGGDFVQSGGEVIAQDTEDTILVVKGNFRRTSNVAGNFSPTNVYLEGTTDAEFAPGTNLTINALHINATGNTATQTKMVTFLQDITVTSDAQGTNGVDNIIAFIVTNDAEVDLNGNLVNITNNGESIVDGTVSDSDNSGAVRFTNGGVASGTGVYSSILVSGPSIDAEDEFQFTGALILLDGGIDIAGDVSPLGPDASVIVNIAANNDPQITGSFNDDEVEYNLVYQDSEATSGMSQTDGTFEAGTEFDTDFIRDLTVDITNAVVNVDNAEDGTISGNVIVRNGNLSNGGAVETATLRFNDDQDIVVLGSTTIEDNAILDLDDDATYAVSTANNVLDGTITGDDTGLLLLRDGATITGTQTTVSAEDNTPARAAQSESRIDADIRLNNDASASLLQIRVITGDIFDQATGTGDAGTLTLGLVPDDADVDDQRFTKDRAGNVNGNVNLDFSTLALASDVQFTEDDGTITISTLNTNTFTFFTETTADGDNDDGPNRLELKNDVQGTGAVWPSSDLTIVRLGNAPQTLTIPVFHPGDDETDDITVASNIRVTNVLRITGNLDAETEDTGSIDYAVILEGVDGSVPTLILDEDYSIENDGSGGEPTDGDRELVINGPINLTINESDDVNPYTDLVVLATQNVQTLTVNNQAQLSDEDATYTVASFVTSAATSAGDGDFNDPITGDEPGQLDLNSNSLSVTGDVTLGSDGAVFNTAAGNGRRVFAGGQANPDFSTFSFIGSNDATLSVTPNENTGVTTFGDGVDLRIAKDSTTTEVTLTGGSLVFDDDFDGFGFDDETLVLEQGTFVAGDSENPNEIYIRLDHNNSLVGSQTSDNGQGFVFVPTNTQFPEAYIEGNVRKRIFSDPSDDTGDTTPGRVVYPVGSSDGSGEGYAEFVLDFESIAQDQSFGLRSVTVAFVDETPSGTLGLPITRANGTTMISEPGNFYWLVTSNPSLGQSTRFNVEARYDGFELESATNDETPTAISELTLIRRQFGDEMTNPFTLVSETYDSFLLQDDGDDRDPVVIAANAQAFLGPQGTIFTYGLDAGNRATDNGGDVPTAFALNGNMPNPFSARTAISFDLPEAAEVSVEVYDVMGRRVISIDNGAMTAGADQRVEIDGRGLASGVYVYRVNVVGASETWTRSGQITLAR
ncbi:T9SS type A sorting domain-containing protein [Rubrivirga sp.]|uniref:beta strand repeat-containing protein n=1 Tax=Rubrivirga sp. TaxID=1885344 RepID=UPI003B51D56A